ncbi:unnamed protein product, partial [Mesorhabditis spiculigera]
MHRLVGELFSRLEGSPTSGCFLNSGSPRSRKMEDDPAVDPPRHPVYGYQCEPAADTSARSGGEDYKSAEEGEEFEIIEERAPSPVTSPPPMPEPKLEAPFTPKPTMANAERLQNGGKTIQRIPERQKTMVVSPAKSPSITAVQDIFAKAKKDSNFEEAERAVISLMTSNERLVASAMAAKVEQLQAKYDQSKSDVLCLDHLVDNLRQGIVRAGKGVQPLHTDNASSLKYDQLKVEHQQLQNELKQLYDTYQNSFPYIDQLKSLIKDLKEQNEDWKKSHEVLNADIAAVGEKYQHLLVHSQDKLNDANDHVRKVEERAERDRLALATKQTAIDSLRGQLDAKVKENQELQDICNALMEKLNQQEDDGQSEMGSI